MSYRSIFTAVALLLASQSAPGQETGLSKPASSDPAPPREDTMAVELLVKVRAEFADGERAVLSQHGLLVVRRIPKLGVLRCLLPAGASLETSLPSLSSDPRIEFAEPNVLFHTGVVPNDPIYASYAGHANDLGRWTFNGIGSDRNLNAEAAWALTTGRPDVVVAIVDTGMDLDHPDLAPNVWTNSGEIPGNGVDDDGNGYVDDVNGYDFRGNDPDPNPDLGDGIDNDNYAGADSNVFHGTFVSSLAAGRGNDGIGMAGAAWHSSLMACKVFTDDGGALSSDIAEAVVYAADNGASVINLSLGGAFSSTLQLAVNHAWTAGCVQVASAGNGNSSAPQFPASLPHVLSVGASDSGSVYAGGSGDIDGRAWFSQFGPAAVDVVAPGAKLAGASVRSAASGKPGLATWTIGSGTSFSAPLVSGLAALLIARSRDLGVTLSNDDLVLTIVATAKDLPDDPSDSPNAGETWDGSGRVDFLAALNSIAAPGGNEPPGADAGSDRVASAGLWVDFDGRGSSDPNGDPLDYQWEFGDGTPHASGSVVTHAYQAAGTFVATLTVSDGQTVDSDTVEVIVGPDVLGPGTYVSFASATTLPGLGSVGRQDIVRHDGSRWLLVFDGSDVGLANVNVDAFSMLADGDWLLSFDVPITIPDLHGGSGGDALVDDSDVVRFHPESLGETTAGSFSLYFDGSRVGLSTDVEDVDAIAFLPSGDLLLSITGNGRANGLTSFQDRDLVAFQASGLGSATAGTFSLWLDGSDVSLASTAEDIDATFLSPTGAVYLSTTGAFSAAGAAGQDEDVLRFTPTLTGSRTAGSFEVFLRGSSLGIPSTSDIDGFQIVE